MATFHSLKSLDLGFTDRDDLSSKLTQAQLAKFMELYVKKEGIKLKRGDVCHYDELSSYRNDNRYIFDGQHLIPFSHELDEYGIIPSSFVVLDEKEAFDINHFDNVRTHNDIVWIAMEGSRLEEALKNIKDDKTTFTYGNKTYTIEFLPEKCSTLSFVDCLKKIGKCGPMVVDRKSKNTLVLDGYYLIDDPKDYLSEAYDAAEIFEDDDDECDESDAKDTLDVKNKIIKGFLKLNNLI